MEVEAHLATGWSLQEHYTKFYLPGVQTSQKCTAEMAQL